MSIQIIPEIKQLKIHQNSGSKEPVLAPAIVTTGRSDRNDIPTPFIPVAGQRNAHFKCACLLAHQINTDLESGRVHYRNRAGELLETLDEVVRAIVSDELMGLEL